MSNETNALVGHAVDALRAAGMGQRADDVQLERQACLSAGALRSWPLRYALAAGLSGAGGLYMIRELNPGAGRTFLRAAQACTEALLAIESTIAEEGEGR